MYGGSEDNLGAFPPHGFWGSDSGRQLWQPTPLPAEPFLQPPVIFFEEQKLHLSHPHILFKEEGTVKEGQGEDTAVSDRYEVTETQVDLGRHSREHL